MLIHNRLQGVDDALFLLDRMAYLFDSAGVDPGHHRTEQFGEHTVTKVLFHQHLIDLLGLSDVRQLLQHVSPIATLQTTRIGDVQVAIEDLNDRVGGLVSTPTRGVNGHHGARISDPVAYNGHWAVVAVSVEADAGQVLVGQGIVSSPNKLLWGQLHVAVHDNQLIDLERVPVLITQGGVKHVLEGESRPSIGQFTLHKLCVVKPQGLNQLTGLQFGHRRGQPFPVVDPLLLPRGLHRPDTDGIATLREHVVDALLCLGGTQEQNPTVGLEDGLKFLDGLSQFVTHGLGR